VKTIRRCLVVVVVCAAWPSAIALACHDTLQGRPACPTLAVRAHDEIYVVYINLNPRDIFFTRSLDGGATWSTPLNLSDNPGDSVRPSIAVSTEGKIYVAWGDNTDGKYDVFLRSSTDAGASWSPRINVTAKIKGQDRLPSIAVDAQGTLYVAWAHKERRPEGDVVLIEREVFLQYSRDGGVTWSAPYSVSRAPSLSPIIRPEIAVDPVGDLHVVWEEEDSGIVDIYYSKGVQP
jgi:Neuraminidase (sialidase)